MVLTDQVYPIDWKGILLLFGPFDLANPLVRPGDIPLLADYFIQYQAERDQKVAPELTSEALDFMQTYPWPSNVRQMHRLMEQVMLSLDGDRITADAIKAHLQEAA